MPLTGSLQTTAFAIASAVFTLRSKFRQPTYHRTRFYMYTLPGLSTFFSLAHGALVYGLEELNERVSLHWSWCPELDRRGHLRKDTRTVAPETIRHLGLQFTR
jgi:hypothetical protein